jgi:chitinase
VSLSAAATETITVNYASANGTATAGSDYVATSGLLTFAPGETVKTVAVPVVGDTVAEANETLTLGLSGASANALIGTATATGTILNDDVVVTPSLAIGSVSAVENTGTFTFQVTLSVASSSSVSVRFATANGTATAGKRGDYLATSGTLTFSPGQTVKTVTVTVNKDTTVEPDETFFVNLSSASGATIAVSRGTGTILNDDGLGAAQLAAFAALALEQSAGLAGLPQRGLRIGR